jgi:hypothetical protein
MSRDRRGVTIIDLPASRRETPNLIDMIRWRRWVTDWLRRTSRRHAT